MSWLAIIPYPDGPNLILDAKGSVGPDIFFKGWPALSSLGVTVSFSRSKHLIGTPARNHRTMVHSYFMVHLKCPLAFRPVPNIQRYQNRTTKCLCYESCYRNRSSGGGSYQFILKTYGCQVQTSLQNASFAPFRPLPHPSKFSISSATLNTARHASLSPPRKSYYLRITP